MVQAGVRAQRKIKGKQGQQNLENGGGGGGNEGGSTRAGANMGRTMEGGPVKNLAPVEVSV